MAVEDGSIKFVVDECLSAPIAKALHHCELKHIPPFHVGSLSKSERGRCETEWMPSRIARGFISISSDTKMISDHDIAAVVQKHGGILFLLRRDASQQRRWELLRWFVRYLPLIATASRNSRPGSTWLVSKDGSMVPVEPSGIALGLKAPTTS